MSHSRYAFATALLALALAFPLPLAAQEEGEPKGDPEMSPTDTPEKPAKKKPGKEEKKAGKLGERLAQAMKPMSVDEMLSKYDADHDGSLSSEEIAAMRAGRVEELAKLHGPNLQRRFDHNGDGTLDEAEKAEMETKLGEAKQRLGQVFDQMLGKADMDGDGGLSMQELERVRQFQAMREMAGEETMAGTEPAMAGKDAMMAGKERGGLRDLLQVDADGDGTLSREELEAAAKRREDAAVEAELPLLDKRYDEDLDGVLSAEEEANKQDHLKVVRLESRNRIYQMMERFDKDVDGALDADEMTDLRGALEGRAEERKEGKGKKKKDKDE